MRRFKSIIPKKIEKPKRIIHTNRKNQFEIGTNQHSKAILQFLHFTKCESLDELVSLDMVDLSSLLTEYEELLRDTLEQTESTIDRKMNCLEYFFKINDIEFKNTVEIGIEKYDTKEWKNRNMP